MYLWLKMKKEHKRNLLALFLTTKKQDNPLISRCSIVRIFATACHHDIKLFVELSAVLIAF